MTKPTGEQREAILKAMNALDKAQAAHGKLLRGEAISDTDRRAVAQTVRLLVAEWV